MSPSRHRAMFVVLALMATVVFLGLRAPAAFAQQGTDSCPLEATIPSLQACVQHAAAMGFIDRQGVTRSLLAKLDAAQTAVDRDQPRVAIQLLQAVVHEVGAQSGKHIDAAHAAHMIAHARVVMHALQALQAPQALEESQ